MAIKKHLGLRGRALRLSMLCTAVLPSYLLYGYNQAVANGLLDLKSWVATFPAIDASGPDAVEKSRIQGTVVAIYTAAGLFGSLFCIWSGDRYGRRKTILFGAIAAAIGSILQFSSFSLAQLIVGRIIAGLGNGGIMATIPNLQSETSAPEKRGAVVQWLSVFVLAGLAVAGWIELGLSFTDPNSVSWRLPMAIPCFFALLVIGAMTFTPESPRWLVLVGRVDEAREILSALDDTDTHSESVNKEVEEIQQAMASSGELGFRHMFRMGKSRLFHRLCICCSIQMFQQITGVNCLAYYETTIFINLGLSTIDARILAASVFTFSAIASITGVYTVDRFGRRPLLLISAIGNGICMAIIAGCSSNLNSTVSLGFACLFVFLFFFFFPVGFLATTFLYAAEISPLQLRVPITAMSTATVWAFNFMTVEVTPVAFATINYKFYIVWAVVCCLVIAPCIYFFFPETKGLSLESIETIFVRSNTIFDSVWVAKKLIKEGGGVDVVGENGENGVKTNGEKEERYVESTEKVG